MSGIFSRYRNASGKVLRGLRILRSDTAYARDMALGHATQD